VTGLSTLRFISDYPSPSTRPLIVNRPVRELSYYPSVCRIRVRGASAPLRRCKCSKLYSFYSGVWLFFGFLGSLKSKFGNVQNFSSSECISKGPSDGALSILPISMRYARCFDICNKTQTSNEHFRNAAEADVGEMSDL
jgi:hypothetical protein